MSEIPKYVFENTMCSEERVIALDQCLNRVVQDKIEGDFVECGTWKGGLAALMLKYVFEHSLVKKVYVYDTFEGMPKPGIEDSETAMEEFYYYQNWCKASIEHVRGVLYNVSPRYENFCELIVGMVEETLEQKKPEKIALIRLDTDWYSSTKKELEILYPILSIDGFLLVDDYSDWPGCAKAIDDYFLTIPEEAYTKNLVDGSLVVQKRS